jgi:hypothetical protein
MVSPRQMTAEPDVGRTVVDAFSALDKPTPSLACPFAPQAGSPLTRFRRPDQWAIAAIWPTIKACSGEFTRSAAIRRAASSLYPRLRNACLLL